jgi:hypothetical protein
MAAKHAATPERLCRFLSYTKRQIAGSVHLQDATPPPLARGQTTCNLTHPPLADQPVSVVARMLTQALPPDKMCCGKYA